MPLRLHGIRLMKLSRICTLNVVRSMAIFPLGKIDTRDKQIYYTNIELGVTEMNQKLHLEALKWHQTVATYIVSKEDFLTLQDHTYFFKQGGYSGLM